MGTVLVVDDDPAITTLVAGVLEGGSHTVLTADRADDALAKMRSTPVDVVVLDVMMPGRSGLDALRELRADPALAAVRVLMLSALDASRDRVAGLREGADDYLGKPFDPDELRLRVERLLATQLRPARPADALASPGCLGRYEVGEMLGRGSMGAVFRGWDPLLRRSVALKTIHSEPLAQISPHLDPMAMLIEEAVSTARVSHPNVVIVHDAGSADGGAFIAMELVEGTSLATLLRRWRKLAPGPMMAVAAAITRGLEAAHLQGIVHHDLKPENVLLGLDGAIKLSDFGLAAVLSALGRVEGLVFGTPGYLPPEVLHGVPMDRRGDLFALGAVLYRGLTGVEPFRGVTLDQIVAATLRHTPPRPRQLAPDIPEELAALVMELLDRDPKRRPATSEVLERLDRLRVPAWDPSFLLRLDTEPVRLEESDHRSCVVTLVAP